MRRPIEVKSSNSAAWIRDIRKRTGESQQTFATRLGIAMGSLSNYERGARLHGDSNMWVKFLREAVRVNSPYAMQIGLRLAETLEISLDELAALIRPFKSQEVARQQASV